jgi:hypothetical protein
MQSTTKEFIMFLGIDMGFWYGLLLTAAITLTVVTVAWLMPPKKKQQTQ